MSERLEELKAMKAWLKPELKDEYNRLKSEGESDTKPKKSSDTVTMTKDELKAFVAEEVARQKGTEAKMPEGFDEAIRYGKWMKKKDLRKSNPVATMRLYRKDGLAEAGLVVDWKFVRYDENPETKIRDVAIYQISVRYDDEKITTYEIPLIELVRLNEQEQVEIVKQDIEIQEMKQGKGQRPYTANGYSFSNPAFFDTKVQVGAGEEFDYIITRKEVNCVVKRPNGQIFNIHSSRLNQ